MNFKTCSKSNKLKNNSENILIFKDTHEAIIDRKTFERVQRHFAGRKRPNKQGRNVTLCRVGGGKTIVGAGGHLVGIGDAAAAEPLIERVLLSEQVVAHPQAKAKVVLVQLGKRAVRKLLCLFGGQIVFYFPKYMYEKSAKLHCNHQDIVYHCGV